MSWRKNKRERRFYFFLQQQGFVQGAQKGLMIDHLGRGRQFFSECFRTLETHA